MFLLGFIGPGFWKMNSPNFKFVVFQKDLNKDTIIVNNGRLKKKDTFLIDDCPELLKKINHRKIKRRNLVEIIKFYNKNCD